MENNLMLLCAYGGDNVALMIDKSFTLSRLVKHVCDQLGDLSPDSISMFFKITRYNKFKMENKGDFQNMLCIARSFQVDHVEVVVELRGEALGEKRRPGVATNSKCERSYGGVSGFTNDVDEDEDLLDNFCPYARKVLLSESWALGISNVGQCFEEGEGEFRKVFNKYVIEWGFQFKFQKKDSIRITAVCMFNESMGCPWSIHARVTNVNGFFYWKKWNNEHTCGVLLWTTKNPRIGSELVADVMEESVCDKPLTHPTDVKYHFQKDYGLQVSYRVDWLGVEKARGELFGDHSASFDQYSNAVMEYNPRSYVNLEFDENYTCCFNRLFVSFKACIDGFRHCHPLSFLDGTFLKGRYKGNLLAATAKDGNKGLFVVAFAIVNTENATN